MHFALHAFQLVSFSLSCFYLERGEEARFPDRCLGIPTLHKFDIKASLSLCLENDVSSVILLRTHPQVLK